MTEQRLMKDGLDRAAIKRIATCLKQVLPRFNTRGFQTKANKGIETLELKQRVDHIIKILHDFLPRRFDATAKALCQLPDVWDKGDQDDPLSGFAIWPVTDYVAVYGLDKPEHSLRVLEHLTPLFSAEFAIRPFIQQHFELTYAQLQTWSENPDEHVRRLVSEGTRPRLPWGMRLQSFVQEPAPILPLLDKLKYDPSLYVRRSVANNLNDISKDNPGTVIKICSSWKSKTKKNQADNINWIVKHATRSLVKQGHREVFPLLGYENEPGIRVKGLRLDSREIRLNESMTFQFTLQGENPGEKYILDYAIHFMKANGKHSAKVFKLKTGKYDEPDKLIIKKTHSFKAITTRKYYPGKHILAIHINGQEVARKHFMFIADK